MKIYWYIKHRNFGGLSLLTGGAWIPQQLDSFRNDIQNITRIYNLNAAYKLLKELRYLKSKKEQNNFYLVKVTIK